MRKLLAVAVMGLLASMLSIPMASADPIGTIALGAEVNCNEWPPQIDFTVDVGPDSLIGDNAVVTLDGVRNQEFDLIFTDHAEGTFFPIDPNVSHTLVAVWYDSLNVQIATDTVTITTPPTCKVPRPTATVSCSGIVLGNADGSANADFRVEINGLAQDFTLQPHQTALQINTVKEGDFIRVLTFDWHHDEITLIDTHLLCGTAPTSTTTGPAATITPGTCLLQVTTVKLDNTHVATPTTFDVNGATTNVLGGQTATVALGAFTGTVTVKVGATVLATQVISYSTCGAANESVTVRLRRNHPKLTPPLEVSLQLAPGDSLTALLTRSCGKMTAEVQVNGTTKTTWTVRTPRHSKVRVRAIFPDHAQLLAARIARNCH